LCRNHTYYVQYFCNKLFSINFKGDNFELIKVFEDILIENEPVYYNYQNLLTKIQWKILNAIALENSVKEPTSSKFLTKYQLGSPSSVQRGLAGLIKNELVILYKKELIVNDVFFHNWLKMNSVRV
ncbi:MAG: ATP-binding protein, partial [Ignavibacteria bacterium]|nr:ATP-binding protein [Ignavibacteria bacterium]